MPFLTSGDNAVLVLDMSATAPQPRKPAGIPEGGQWAPMSHAEADIELVSVLKRRTDEMDQVGFVRATVARTALRRSGAGEWWAAHWALGEQPPDGVGEYPKMPDDETPAQAGGRSLSGHRRTHTMAYRGAGVELRMPSAAAARRYAAQLSDATKQATVTFDIPVSATYPGKDGDVAEVSGWVRATRSGDGSWSTRALGFPSDDEVPGAGAYVAESTQCVLEARRPSRALRDVGDLLERRRQRHAKLGVKLKETRSTWVRQIGYDYTGGAMIISTGEHTYGYKTSPGTYQAIASSYSPGWAYNRLVRGKSKRVEVVECPSCGRYFTKVNGAGKHKCPPKEAGRKEMADGDDATGGITKAALAYWRARGGH